MTLSAKGSEIKNFYNWLVTVVFKQDIKLSEVQEELGLWYIMYKLEGL